MINFSLVIGFYLLLKLDKQISGAILIGIGKRTCNDHL